MGRNKKHRVMLILIMGLLGACQAYEVQYVGQTQITEHIVKSPGVGPPGQYDKVVRNNTAFHFTLENMETKNLDTDFIWIKAFICGQYDFETNLLSALYFPDEIKFVGEPPISQTNKSFYAVFVPRVLAEMKEHAKMQGKPMCAHVIYHQTWEFEKISNIVKLE